MGRRRRPSPRDTVWTLAERGGAMRYCIAIDGGGSKTESVLFDETGHILRRHVGVGGNPTDTGPEEARRRLRACMAEILPGAPPLAALYGGMAGILPNGDIYSEDLEQTHVTEHIRIEDDGCSLISGTLGHGDGCGMVCGTGSSLFVRIEGQPLRHIGGKGYLIDTGGSGYELGKEAVCMALRAVDGRCRGPVLTELLAEILGQEVSDAVIPKVHRGGRPYIATFASAVFAGRKAGDWACEEIFDRGAALMADLVHAAARYFNGAFSVVIGGGIAANFPEYVEAIRKKSPPQAQILLQEAPPVYGAAVEALWDAGIEVTGAVRARFLADYTTLRESGVFGDSRQQIN